MKKILFLFWASSIFYLTSCDNELDMLDEYKETAVVYGILNQKDSIHYIKINKAFLGAGNAFDMAQQPDSFNYSNILDVKVEKWKNGKIITSYILSRDSSILKPSATFNGNPNILYKFQSNLTDDSEYRLNILNKKNGNIISSTTNLVKDFSIENPKTTQTSISLTNLSYPYKVEWKSAENGKLYQLVIRFHYTEKNKLTGFKEEKYLDWNLGTQKSNNTTGGELMSIAFTGSSFFQYLAHRIPENNELQRFAGSVDFIFEVAAEEFSTYVEVSQPANGILQEKPVYTNIENGIGIFSSAYTKGQYGRKLSKMTNDSLACGAYTHQLGFAYYELVPATNGIDTLFCN